MDRAFWDSSALVLLCIEQQSRPEIKAWSKQFARVVWWGTPIEINSAFTRLVRFGHIKDEAKLAGQAKLSKLVEAWIEILPSSELRDIASDLLYLYPLRAADSLQLAAAMIWCRRKPSGRNFITSDARLAEAASHTGFSLLIPGTDLS